MVKLDYYHRSESPIEGQEKDDFLDVSSPRTVECRHSSGGSSPTKPLSKSKLVVAVGVKRSVRFCSKVKVRVIRKVDDLTDDEIDAAWYSKDEFEKIRQRENKLSKLASQQTGSNQEAMLILYAIASDSFRSDSRIKIKEYTLSILAEQERQWRLDVNDSFLLASVSHFLATKSREQAVHRGNVLAKHVKSMDTRRTKREQRESRRPKRLNSPMSLCPPHSPLRISSSSSAGKTSSASSPPMNSPCTRRWKGHSSGTSPTRRDATILLPPRR